MKQVESNNNEKYTDKTEQDTRMNENTQKPNNDLTDGDKPYPNVKNERPYMGNLTSHEIGMMARSGAVDGDMFKRMISNVEQDTEDGPILP